MNASRTFALRILTLVVQDFSFAYRQLLFETFLPLVRKLFTSFQLYTLADTAVSNPGDHQTFMVGSLSGSHAL